MYDPNDILGIVDDAVNEIKNTDQPNARKIADGVYYNEDNLPNFSPAYKRLVEWMERIAIHAKKDTFPEKLFSARAPNQTDDEYIYTRTNYKQVTLPVAVDYLNTIKRCFHDPNWKIEWGVDPEGQVKAGTNYSKYVTEDLPHYGSVENYVKNVLPSIKTIDANGVILVRPIETPMIENGDGDLELSGDFVEPVPIYYSAKQVVKAVDDEFGLFMMDEKSPVKVGNKTVMDGLMFEFVDTETIYRIKQFGTKTEYNFEVVVYYQHNLGYLPFMFTKGNPTNVNGQNCWESPYLSVVDVLDQVLLDSSNLMAVKATCVFPYRIMTGDICDFKIPVGEAMEPCNGRGQVWDEGRKMMITCGNCGGSGMKNRMSPQGVLLLRPKTTFNEGDTGFSNPGLSYVSPTTDTPEFLRSEIQNNMNEARKILHLHTSNSDVKGSDNMTATGMALDMKALYAFVKPISDQMFDMFQFLLKTIGDMRYGDSFEVPSLIYPQSFDFYTESEYMAQIASAIDSGLPSFMVQTSVRDYIMALYMNDEKQAKKFQLIMDTDRLIHMTPDEIAVQNARGLVANWEVVLHDSSMQFIDQLLMDNPDFWELEKTEQQQLLIDMAKAKATENLNAQRDQRTPELPPITP